ncbi:MAG: hypothetical protein IPJ14_11690 [Kineosporiaceae bacterium]|nr:hypothetical protein [Kineosporiaceae bacterium]MBK7623289.1 hypothetical protein [Kineosporiaceae bacterium]MBK8074759.1 hypothetical protein [Kineosporiaceae bacterium]
MAKFVVTLHYTVAPAVPARRDFDALADRVGSGHRFSMLGADTLAVSVRIKAGSAAEAVQVLDIRVRAAWPMLDGGTLTLATAMANGDLVEVGAARTTSTGRTSRVSRTLRFFGPGRSRPSPWDDPGWDSGGNDWGGGTAGVREPRRPRTPPGHLAAELDLPRQA